MKMAGYDGYSKSNNAVDAEGEGRYPLTKAARIVARETGITVKAARSILLEIRTIEYHHSSKFFNCVDYYDTKEPIRVINHMTANGFDDYETAREDLEEKEYEEYERETMLSPDFIIAFNVAVKRKGPVPLPSAYKRIFVQELKNVRFETKMRISSKWYFMTPDNERMLCETLRQNGIDV
jgi:hypothetical protein